jgi:anti-sigma factor RsiW
MKRFDEDDRLHALIDGEVEPDIRAELEVLLYDDPTLRGRFDEHARHKAGLREAADDLAAAASSSSSLKTHRLTLRLRAALWSAAAFRVLPKAAAAIALVGVGALGHAVYEARQNAVEPVYAFETGDQRLVLDADNMKTSLKLEAKSPGLVSRETTRWLGRAVNPPRLSRQGLALVDARLMQADGHKLVGLIYEDAKGQRLTLSIGADPDGQPDALKTVDTDGGRADYWSDGRASYVLVDERDKPTGDPAEELSLSGVGAG